jgi:hypothetical protein
MMHQLNLALSSFIDGLRSFRSPGFLLPLAVNTVVQLLLLAVLVLWHLPVWSGFFTKLFAMFPGLGRGALHYPSFYLVLPSVFGLLDFLLVATVGAYLWGVAVVAAANLYGYDVGSPWATARKHLGSLIVASLPAVGFGLVTFFGTAKLFEVLSLGGPPLAAARYIALPMLYVVVQSLFIFAPMAVVLEGKGAVPALGRALSMWKHNMVAAVFLVALVAVWHSGTNWFYNHLPQFMDQFRPELVAGVIGGDIVLSFFTYAILVAGATAMFYTRRAHA